MGVEENIAARQRALDVMSLCDTETERFYEELARLCADKVGLVVAKPTLPNTPAGMVPMGEREAIYFEESSYMPFGEFKGVAIGLVPTGRIDWYLENDFAVRLKRYILSDRYKQRQREE